MLGMRMWRAAAMGLLAAAIAASGSAVCAGGSAVAHAQYSPAVHAYKLDVAGPGDAPLELYAEEQGRGSPVVLLHGLGGSTYSWRFIAPYLARSHRVIAIDLKGFGRSDKVFDTAYSAADQARLIAAFLARRHLSHVTLIGHSFGGQVAMLTALQLARHEPSRIARLVLIDTPALPQPLTPAVALLRQPVLPYALFSLLPPEILTRLALARPSLRPLTRAYTEADTLAYAEPFYDAAARHAYIQTAREIVPDDLERVVARYRGISQRALLVWCAADDVVPPATGRALSHILPNARFEEIGGCNHSPPDEAPAALAASLHRFLDPSQP